MAALAAIDLVLAKLHEPKKTASGWKARCPAHEDHTPSLTIAEGKDGRVLLKCFAGCDVEHILRALGLDKRELFASKEPAPASRTVAPRKKATIAAYEVRDPAGTLVAVHVRTDSSAGKDIKWRQPDGRSGLNGTPVVELPLYGSERAASWDLDKPVFLVEGEKAAQALIDAGWQAVGTVTGASTTPSEGPLAVLAGCDVILWADNDDIGRTHISIIADKLVGSAASVRFVNWLKAPEHGDAADFLTGDEPLEPLISQAEPYVLLKPGALGMDAADLIALHLPPTKWVVPDLIPEGTTVLAAPPKIGKSCLVYQLAVEAAIGGELLDRRVSPGAVLYLALEDGQRRGRERLLAALSGRTMPRGRLEVRWSAKPLGKGLEEQIVEWLDAHPDAILVAIDTLQRVRPSGDARRNAYEVDVADLGRLQSLFRDRNVALLVVHHARKASTDDFLASVSGTYGITGSADTTIVIKRVRQNVLGSIVVTGRDVAEAEIPVQFADMLWKAAPGSLSVASFERSQVYELLLHRGPMFATAIGEVTELSRGGVQNMLKDMTEDGTLVRTTKGYAVATRPESSIHGAPYVSPNSSDYESHQSHPPYTRARAREDDPEVWWNKDA